MIRQTLVCIIALLMTVCQALSAQSSRDENHCVSVADSMTFVMTDSTASVMTDSTAFAMTDSLMVDTTDKPRKLSLIRRIVRGFDRLDERYIEPQHYVFTAMLQATYSYDMYMVNSMGDVDQRFTFAPDGTAKMGPYFGWKWFFAGYTFSLGHSNFSKNKTELGLNIYSSQIGVDLIYRRTGSDYKLRNVKLRRGIDSSRLDEASFDGVKAGITGINLYYIFNHGRFSYPAAFSQSTCQKISCGSWMAGLGYMQNSLELDYNKLQTLVDEKLGYHVPIDSGLMFKDLNYHDISLSCGYAYNWVFAPRWLMCASGQLALGYKRTVGDATEGRKGFQIEHVSPNIIGRFALVYNNMTWYWGISAIINSNTYRESHFLTNNTFGNMNMYVGYNFGMKRKYRK